MSNSNCISVYKKKRNWAEYQYDVAQFVKTPDSNKNNITLHSFLIIFFFFKPVQGFWKGTKVSTVSHMLSWVSLERLGLRIIPEVLNTLRNTS